MLISQSTDPRMCEDSAWWALYTRHQHEKAVAEMLSAKDLEVFLPLYESRRRWKDRCKTLSLPLFPGYLFVRGGLDRRADHKLRGGARAGYLPCAALTYQKVIPERLGR